MSDPSVKDAVRASRDEYIGSFSLSKGPPALPSTSGLRARVGAVARDVLPRPMYEAAVGYGYYGLRSLAGRNPGRGRVLPDFLLIGAAKAGTTSLFRWLSDHPQIAPPSPPWLRGVPMKEVHFFDYNFYRRPDWYRAHFPLARERQEFEREHGAAFVTGEGSASYLSHRWAPERVKGTLPHAKLIVVLRNPIDRAYSQFQMSCREGYENLAFEEAIAAEPERLDAELARVERDRRYNSLPLGTWSYLFRGHYDEHIGRWLEFFPREQFLFVKAEEMFRDPYATLDAVSDFLGVTRFRPQELARLKDGGSYEPLSDEVRSQLAAYFRPHNERLGELTGIDFRWSE